MGNNYLSVTLYCQHQSHLHVDGFEGFKCLFTQNGLLWLRSRVRFIRASQSAPRHSSSPRQNSRSSQGQPNIRAACLSCLLPNIRAALGPVSVAFCPTSMPILSEAEVRRSFNTTTVWEGATCRVRTGDRRYPILCYCQLGQDIPLICTQDTVRSDLCVDKTIFSSSLTASNLHFAVTMGEERPRTSQRAAQRPDPRDPGRPHFYDPRDRTRRGNGALPESWTGTTLGAAVQRRREFQEHGGSIVRPAPGGLKMLYPAFRVTSWMQARPVPQDPASARGSEPRHNHRCLDTSKSPPAS